MTINNVFKKNFMKYFFINICIIIISYSTYGQKIQIVPKKNINDTNIKTLKVITNKEEFNKHFADSLTYKELMPYVQIPGTKISIAPPKNFKISEQIRGFVHLATTTSITCSEIKGFHYTTVVENITPETLLKQNANLKSIEDVQTSSGKPAKLILLGFSLPSKDTSKKETPFERLMLFTGDLDNTIWVSATYPEAVKPFVFEMVKKSLLSVKIE